MGGVTRARSQSIPPRPQRLGAQTFDAAELAREHPPRLRVANKQLVYDIACPNGQDDSGAVHCSRWAALAIDSLIWPGSEAVELRVHQGVFDYADAKDAVSWTLNFAHSDLFCAYGGPHFAQDEIQVAEHPALASVREALLAYFTGRDERRRASMSEPARALADGMLPCTVVAGRPTPVLIAGAPRRCVVATDIDPARGRPLGLYGRRFARASPEVVRMATTRLVPPTRSNILAMEAPACLRGVYTEEQLHHILETAITGFSAARAVSGELAPGRATMIHTGYWGCGAYGGDRTLMAMLQLVAAATSGIERVVFHVVDRQGRETFARASAALDTLAGELAPAPMSELIACLAAMGFRWGVSDGN